MGTLTNSEDPDEMHHKAQFTRHVFHKFRVLVCKTSRVN